MKKDKKEEKNGLSFSLIIFSAIFVLISMQVVREIGEETSIAKDLSLLNENENNNNDVILLFDGVCNLCNGVINFVMNNNEKKNIKFASLQSPIGDELMKKHDIPNDLSTLVYIENNRAYVRSTAVLRLTRQLDWPWNLISAAIIVPIEIRDSVYRLVAASRYSVFGKGDRCRLPSLEEQRRFLDWDESKNKRKPKPLKAKGKLSSKLFS